jgi:type IV pilus assembly protein PilY1
MKPIKPLFLLILFILFLSLFPLGSYAHDTDIYLASGEGVQPNILIIFDNSGSMADSVQCQPVETKVYQKRDNPWGGGYYWDEFADDINAAIAEIETGGTVCPVVRPNLESTGYHSGYTRLRRGNCTRNYLTLATGAWINTNDPQHADIQCAKLDVAKGVIDDFLANIQNVRVGVMVFNNQSCEKDQYGVCIPGGSSSEHEGGKILGPIDSIAVNRATLRAAVDGLSASTYTPLAETLYEAGLYFKGQRLFDPNSYANPVLYSCQKNYVILITDGMSTRDHNAVLNTLSNNGDYDGKGEDPYGPSPCSSSDPCYDSGGTDYLNDVAKYIYDTQGISVYTIGFAIDYDLLKRAAEQANGHYYTASDAQQLEGAFANVIDEILSKSTSFVAPIVPVSRLERTTAGDKIYLALFKPKKNKMWSGNIKKYGVAQTYGADYSIGDLLDRNGVKAVDDTIGQFYAASISYWNATQDGGEVEEGGAGEVLQKRDLDTRKIYTFFKSSGKVNLYDDENAFTTTNPLLTTTVLNLASGSKDDLINFVYGYDAYQDESTDVNATRSWILGSFLHSRPYIVHYKTQSVLFVGSNDGMLHAFADADGSELWAFIPPDLLPNLQYLHSDYNMAYVDGSPKVYVTYDSDNNVTKAILIFGQRRGGNRYYALDVTIPSQPKFLWYISPTERVYQTTTYTTTDYEELGQSWSAPILGKIACSGGSNCVDGKRVVAFIGGGYDATNQDKGIGTVEDPYTTLPDSDGRAIYVVDVLDGTLVKRFSNAENANMTYSIPSDITIIDLDGNRTIDRLYVGDMAGRMWRFDIQDTNPSNWTGKIVFKSNPDGATTNLRKMFYPPDVTLEVGNYEMVLFGTGDREHPNDKIIVNRLYAVKDKNLADTPSNRAYIESDLYDATDNLLQTGTAEQRTTALSALTAAKGWLIQLLPSTSGEKCLASPVVFYGVAYFTTFAPSSDAPPPGTDPCYVGEGTARLYELGYKDAMAVFDLDGDTVYEQSDRSQAIGTAIPSGVIITVIQNRVVGYAGMGGGVIGSRGDPPPCLTPPCPPPPPPCGQGGPEICFKSGKVLVPINWRIVFEQ